MKHIYNKQKRILKMIGVVFTIIFVNINVFANIVSGDEGDTFVTKSAFDTLKNDFAGKINDYYKSIDGKVAGNVEEYVSNFTQRNSVAGLLNSLSEKQSFCSSWTLPSPTLGSGYKYYFNVGLFYCLASQGTTLAQIQLLTGSINTPQWKNVNTTNYGNFLYGQKADTDKYVLTNTLKSLPISVLTGVSIDDNKKLTSNTVSIPANNFTKGNETSQGAYADTWHSTNFGGIELNIPVLKIFTFEDTMTEFNNSLIPGTALNSTTDYYFVEDIHLNDLCNDDAAITVNPAWYGYEVQTAGVGWRQYSSGDWITNNTLKIYKHTYDTMHLTDIINQEATNVLGDTVYIYNGLPVYKSEKFIQNLIIDLHFENTASSYTDFILKKGPFNNTTIQNGSETASATLETTIRVASGQTIRFELANVNKDEVFFVKAKPASGETKITTENIILE